MKIYQLNTELYYPAVVQSDSEFVMSFHDVNKLRKEAQKRISEGYDSAEFASRHFLYKNVVWRLWFTPYKKIENSRKNTLTDYSYGAYLEVADSRYRLSGWTVSVEATISCQIEPDVSRVHIHDLKHTYQSESYNQGFQSTTPWSIVCTMKTFIGWASVKFSKVTCNTPPPTRGPYVSSYQSEPEPPTQSETTDTPSCSPPPAETHSSQPEKVSTSSSEEKRGEKRKAAEALSNSECPICMDQYTDPHITRCGHTFCKKCIDGLFRNVVTAGCPLCNKRFAKSECSPNFALKDLLSAQQQVNPFLTLSEASSSSTSSSLSNPTPDDACFNYRQCRAETKLYCIACKLKICSDCHEQYHTKTAFTRSHTLCKKSLLCSTHEEQHQYYCSSCDCLICVRCAIESHREHQGSFVPLQQHVDNRRAEIAKLVSHFPEDIETLNKKRDTLVAQIQTIKERAKRVRNKCEAINALYSEALEAEDDALTLGFEALVSRVQEAAKRK